MSNYSNFSSWPPEIENSFVVYEEQSVTSQKKAFNAGLIAGVGLLVVVVGIALGVDPKKDDLAKDMDMSSLSNKKADSK